MPGSKGTGKDGESSGDEKKKRPVSPEDDDSQDGSRRSRRKKPKVVFFRFKYGGSPYFRPTKIWAKVQNSLGPPF